MNTNEYLRKQGWRGEGHSLDKTGRGIKKPLLISKKVDVLGVGLNKHAAVSDQWWLRAFDQSLKDFGTGKESMLSNVQKHGVNRGGLYGRFVQGQSIGSTFDDTPQTSAPSIPPATTTTTTTKKRKRSRQNEMDDHVDMNGTSDSVEPAVFQEKLEQYRIRAQEKGLTIEEYIKKREAKNKAKRDAKKLTRVASEGKRHIRDCTAKTKHSKTRRKKKNSDR